MNKTKFLWTCVAVALTTLIVFAAALNNGFVNYDDDRAILHNPYLVSGTPRRIAWMWSTFHLGHYQPLSWLSLAMDHELAGTSPLAYHADSIVWHAAAAVLLFVLLKDLIACKAGLLDPPTVERSAVDRRAATTAADTRRATTAAALAALFWSLHPLRVESVAWATERRDPISAVFLLLAAIAYVRSAQAGARRTEKRRRALYALSLASLLMSLLAKAWGMTFFVVLIALDLWPLRRLPPSLSAVTDQKYRRVWLEKLPFALLGALAAVLAWFAQRAQQDAMLAVTEWPIVARVLQAAYGLCFYPAKTVWPTSLAIVYPLPQSGVPPAWIACLFIIVAAAAGIVAVAGRWPGLAAATVAYAAIVSPVLGVAQSGPQAVADRYAYVAAMPFSALIAGALMQLSDRAWRRAAAAAVAVLVALAVLTSTQIRVWHDSIALWRHALDAGYASALAHVDYGQALRAAGQLEPAIAEYRRGLALKPDDGNAWYNLGNSLKAAGDLAGAETAYKQAIAHLPRNVEAQVNLGNLYYNQRRLPEAIARYRAAIAETADTRPELVAPEPYLYLGMALADNGDAAAAREPLGIALRYASTRARAAQELRRIEATR